MTENETNDTNQTPETAEIETTENEVETTEAGQEKEFKFVEDPTFDIDYKGDCAYEVKVSVPTANEAKLSEDVFTELAHEAEVPGFRKGKAPRKLIEKKFSRVVRSDVELKLVNAAFQKLIEDKDFSPLNPPEVEDFEKNEERAEGTPLEFTLKFEVRPRVELGKYRGIEVERPVFKVEDKDVDGAIEQIRSRFGVYETVKEGEAADGDQVVIDFKGTIDGEEFQGGAAQNYPYILGTKRFFPEFEAALVGAKPNETVTCEVQFPDDYSAQHVRGKTAHFEITVKELKRRIVPEISDDFAKQAGFESAEDMRNKVAERLRENAAKEGNTVAEQRALKTIVEGSTFEIPKSLIAKMSHDTFESRVNELRQSHVSAHEIEEHEAEMREIAEKDAIENIKTWVTLEEVASAEGIEVTDEDFEQEAAAMAQRSGVAMEAAAKFLGDEDRRGRYAMRFLQNKTLAAIISHANITDKELSPEEFQKEVEAETPAED